jgi:ribosomal protein S18 acetylase RimI-like enzyme
MEMVFLKIRLAQSEDEQNLIWLIAAFRVGLAELRGKARPMDLAAARDKLVEYTAKNLSIFVAEDDQSSLAGYLVCRVDGDVVWVEFLFTAPEYRRQGVGSALHAEAECLAQERGSSFPYNWVDPNNDPIIRFLQNRGYNVLNLIELRRPYPGEELTQQIKVGSHVFER